MAIDIFERTHLKELRSYMTQGLELPLAVRMSSASVPDDHDSTLLKGDLLLATWRSRRTQLAALTLLYSAFVLISIATAMIWGFRLPPAAKAGSVLAIVGCFISIAALRFDKSNAWAWIPFYATIWIGSSILIYESGGLFSPLLALSLLKYFIFGLALQTAVRPRFFFWFLGLNLIVWCIIGGTPSPLVLVAEGREMKLFQALSAFGTGTAVYLLYLFEAPLSQEVAEGASELFKSRLKVAMATEANAAKEAFLRNVSHEIRTPITAIVGNLSVALDEATPPEERRQLSKSIFENSHRLAQCVTDILEYADITTSQQPAQTEEVSLAAVLNGVVEQMTPELKKKGLELRLDIDPSALEPFVTDPRLLHRALLHLAENAIKFTSTGHVKLSAKREPVPGTSRTWLNIAVEDTGCGIAAGDQSRLFQPFSQVDASLTRKTIGSGLGLALVRDLCRLLGGHARLDNSVLGQGSKFSVTLPFD